MRSRWPSTASAGTSVGGSQRCPPQSLRDSSPRRGERLRRRRGPALALPSSAPTGRPQVPQATPRRPVRCGLRVPGPASGDRARRWPAHGAACLRQGHGTSTFANAAFACCGFGMTTSCAAWTTCSMRSRWPSTANAGTSVGGSQRSPLSRCATAPPDGGRDCDDAATLVSGRTHMNYRRVRRTGLRVSDICLGTTFGFRTG